MDRTRESILANPALRAHPFLRSVLGEAGERSLTPPFESPPPRRESLPPRNESLPLRRESPLSRHESPPSRHESPLTPHESSPSPNDSPHRALPESSTSDRSTRLAVELACAELSVLSLRSQHDRSSWEDDTTAWEDERAHHVAPKWVGLPPHTSLGSDKLKLVERRRRRRPLSSTGQLSEHAEGHAGPSTHHYNHFSISPPRNGRASTAVHSDDTGNNAADPPRITSRHPKRDEQGSDHDPYVGRPDTCSLSRTGLAADPRHSLQATDVWPQASPRNAPATSAEAEHGDVASYYTSLEDPMAGMKIPVSSESATHADPDGSETAYTCGGATNESATRVGDALDALRAEGFDEHRLPTKAELWAASFGVVYDAEGQMHPFRDFFPDGGDQRASLQVFPERRTVVLFIRAMLCGQCQDYVRTFSQLDLDAIAQANVRVVIITNGPWEPLKNYRDMFALPFEIYTDPTLKLYQALGMTPKISQLETVVSVFKAPKNKPAYHRTGPVTQVALGMTNAMRIGLPLLDMGSITQMGGEFVFQSGYRCTYAHRMPNKYTHALAPDVLRAAGVISPERDEPEGDTASQRTGMVEAVRNKIRRSQSSRDPAQSPA
ncbi:hypothetical protein Q8F55_002072 [Vanrija albida]|uniref:Alkyl hydroperoxide reductase subunit C/ Thiol specific antioxidant domain-containing protein n=1 Tax=Vanrija albida TaxID=181172 RepID=A0ABR3Q9C9_9TREE